MQTRRDEMEDRKQPQMFRIDLALIAQYRRQSVHDKDSLFELLCSVQVT